MEKKQEFLRGAMVLSIAGALSKVMGAVYRIPLARLLGSEGIGIYQMAYPIYTTILSLATAGVPVAISVLISRKEAQGFYGDDKKIFRISLLMLFIFGLILTLVVMKSAYFIANYILVQPRAYYPIMAVAPAIFLSALMSVFRGYFQGQQSMIPTAVSQVIEQLFRVSAVLIFAFLLFPMGLEYATAGATGGAVVGGIAGLIVLVIFYIHKQRQDKLMARELRYSGESSWQMGKEMVMLAIPVSFGAVVLPLVQMLDAVIVPGRLMAIGYNTSQATALYGQLSGMAALLISLPTIFTISVSTSLVPAVSEALAQKNRHLLISRINYGLRAGMIISLPSAAGLFILAFPICDLLYATPEAGLPLQAIAFSAIALAAFQLSSAGLQGIGRPEIGMRHLIITGILKIILNFSLTSIPWLNIQGAAIGTVLAFMVGSGLNIYSLQKLTGISYEVGRLSKLILITLGMAVITKLTYSTLVGIDISSHLSTVIAILAGVFSYGILLLLFKEIDFSMLKKISGK